MTSTIITGTLHTLIIMMWICSQSFHTNATEIPDTIILPTESLDTLTQSTDTPATPIISTYSETTSKNDPTTKFRPKQLILPGALIAVGTFGVYNKGFRKFDRSIRHAMTHLRGDHYFRIDNYLQYLPAATYLTFGSIGIKSKHNFRERVAVEATAYIAMAAITNAAKYTFREMRPDCSTRNSFPSGHTATAFTGAELMREEYGLGLGIASYTVATGVAFLRLYNNRHWLNDVIAGAGVGILSARIGYWMLPLYRKWFKWNQSPTSKIMSMLPSYDSASHSMNLNMMLVF